VAPPLNRARWIAEEDDVPLAVAVLGPGGVGGFLAALLWRAGTAVTCVATESTANRLTAEGLRLQSAALGDFVAAPRAVSRLDVPVDVLFVTTKAGALPAALDRVDPALTGAAVIIPLLNGIEHLSALRARLGDGVIAATIGQVEAKRLSPVHILHTTPSARIEMATSRRMGHERLEAVARLLREIGLTAEVRDSEPEVLWGKLVRLSAIAVTTAATGRPIGEVREDPEWRGRLRSCVNEAAAVAGAEGMPTDPEAVMRQIDALPAALGTSMQRDVDLGQPSELDDIAGAIVRAGARHGISCQTIEAAIASVRIRAERTRSPEGEPGRRAV
jgi:2-dehydropantoate 2-reductase